MAGSGAGPAVVRFAGQDVVVMSGETLRHTERLLAAQYGADVPPKLLDANDLESDDLFDAEHWVKVYTELVEFTRGLLDAASGQVESGEGNPASDEPPCDLRALRLAAEVQQLHLTFWLDRLHRLRADPQSDPDRSG